jgi:hypothetical protein
MKQIIAYCDYTLEVTCPNCKKLIDLTDQDEGYDQEGEYSRQVFGDWNKEFDVMCYSCESDFTVEGILT